mmetsp:Transcript_35985/g.64324  ORF Transcript_35985/g.64324 Transcript_35985/m.64324 type:complete len:689 (-) Transcript_35985:748-2814(-)
MPGAHAQLYARAGYAVMGGDGGCRLRGAQPAGEGAPPHAERAAGVGARRVGGRREARKGAAREDADCDPPHDERPPQRRLPGMGLPHSAASPDASGALQDCQTLAAPRHGGGLFGLVLHCLQRHRTSRGADEEGAADGDVSSPGICFLRLGGRQPQRAQLRGCDGQHRQPPSQATARRRFLRLARRCAVEDRVCPQAVCHPPEVWQPADVERPERLVRDVPDAEGAAHGGHTLPATHAQPRTGHRLDHMGGQCAGDAASEGQTFPGHEALAEWGNGTRVLHLARGGTGDQGGQDARTEGAELDEELCCEEGVLRMGGRQDGEGTAAPDRVSCARAADEPSAEHRNAGVGGSHRRCEGSSRYPGACARQVHAFLPVVRFSKVGRSGCGAAPPTRRRLQGHPSPGQPGDVPLLRGVGGALRDSTRCARAGQLCAGPHEEPPPPSRATGVDGGRGAAACAPRAAEEGAVPDAEARAGEGVRLVARVGGDDGTSQGASRPDRLPLAGDEAGDGVERMGGGGGGGKAEAQPVAARASADAAGGARQVVPRVGGRHRPLPCRPQAAQPRGHANARRHSRFRVRSVGGGSGGGEAHAFGASERDQAHCQHQARVRLLRVARRGVLPAQCRRACQGHPAAHPAARSRCRVELVGGGHRGGASPAQLASQGCRHVCQPHARIGMERMGGGHTVGALV